MSIAATRRRGDEAAWQRAVDAFFYAIAADPEVQGRFRYVVTVGTDGVTRTHFGRWDSAQTLETVQARDYFKAFAGSVRGFAGDTLEATRMRVCGETGSYQKSCLLTHMMAQNRLPARRVPNGDAGHHRRNATMSGGRFWIIIWVNRQDLRY
jgi:hypothetical protein